MTQRRIVFRRVILDNSRVVAEAKSVVGNMDGSDHATYQTVTVRVSSDGSRSSSSASSASYSSAAKIQTSSQT